LITVGWGEPLAFDQQPYIAGVPKGLRPLSRTGHQNISVIPREIADGEVLIARLAARVVQQHQPTADDPMQRRLKQRPDDSIG
jgi:hypothetical protein